MLLNGKLGETDRGGPRPLPAGISILVHAAAILLVANAGPVQLPKPKSAYQQAIAGREQKLV